VKNRGGVPPGGGKGVGSSVEEWRVSGEKKRSPFLNETTRIAGVREENPEGGGKK